MNNTVIEIAVLIGKIGFVSDFKALFPTKRQLSEPTASNSLKL